MRRRLWGLLPVLFAAPLGHAWAGDGGVVGWVEDAKGTPVSGALVSLFGRGLKGGGLLTQTDGFGRFTLPALPAGSYTLRAIGEDSAATRRITVLPNQDSVLTLSFGAGAQVPDLDSAVDTGSPAERELRWLLRHKPRSVLESQGTVVAEGLERAPEAGRLLEGLIPWIPDLAGTVQVVTSPGLGGAAEDPAADPASPNLGSLRLEGRLARSGRWSLGGLLADAQTTTWRMAAEFVVEPGGGHHFQSGAGYGTRLLEPGMARADTGRLDNRSVGAVFAHDRWQLNDRVQAALGARYSYVGFLEDRNYLSPDASLGLRLGRRTHLRGSASSRMLAPGGDLLTLSTLSAAPAMAVAFVGSEVRPERLARYELAVDRALGKSSASAFAFREGVRDHLVNVLGTGEWSRSLRIVNGGGFVIEGLGLSLGRRFGDLVNSSVTYSYGRSRPAAAFADPRWGQPTAVPLSSPGGFHDVVTRVETFIDSTGTRVVAYYRMNAWVSEVEDGTSVNTRFDVQITQGLPFLKSMTRTEWEILVAFRNLFYETTEGSTLDEIAVVAPPKRLVGGISVRF